MFWGNRVADRCLCSQYMWVDGGRLYGKGQLIIYGTGVLNISMRSDFFLIYYFFFGCPGVYIAACGLLWLWRAGATLYLLCTGGQTHCGGFSCCRTQALGMQAMHKHTRVIFQILFPHRLLYNIEYSPLWYTGFFVCLFVLSPQSYLTLCDPMNCLLCIYIDRKI